ncbi:MAG TPA: class A beta-lactamase-related serine hydrolase [Leucothrix mucor]|uniref:Class A beta-lactamase-related serine hydrolase n=1 Tax=Leucothrix mucor TaxID=45248 RepID=A0A7V2T4L0_LEUMU|nr:class A beta-lactamase-related serine hydrolase [Leucothrix mucor]
MITKHLDKIGLTLILLGLSSCSNLPKKPASPVNLKAGDYRYLKKHMSWFINKEMRKKNVVGLSIALIDDQKIVWQQGFGFADREKQMKADAQTRYRAGSISKVFTSMVVMKLVEAGKMNLDQPLVRYLPEFKIKSRFGSTDKITLRTILTHHSGLPSDWADRMWAEKPLHFTKLVTAIKEEYTGYPVNKVLSYSNLAISLLGHAVQKVSGQNYSEHMRQTLLTPMNMHHSEFALGLTGKHAAKSYRDGKAVRELPLGKIPAGGLNTTVADLAQLAKMLNKQGKIANRQILSPQSIKTMFTVQNKNIPLDLGNKIGLAWFVDDRTLAGKERVYGHNGATIAHRAVFAVSEKSKLGIVILSNTDSTPILNIAKELLQTAWQAKYAKKLPVIEPKPLASPLKDSAMTGTYTTILGIINVIEKSSNRYQIKSKHGTFDLLPSKNGKLHLKYRLLGLFPIEVEKLKNVSLSVHKIDGYQVIVAERDQYRRIMGIKVEPKAISNAWRKRLGHYKIVNPQESDFTQIDSVLLKVENGFLIAQLNYADDSDTMVLTTVNDNEAIIEGLGRRQRETIRIITDKKGQEVIFYSGLRFKQSYVEKN